MSKAEVELPRLFASRDIPDPVLVKFTIYFPVDREKEVTAEIARPDARGYRLRGGAEMSARSAGRSESERGTNREQKEANSDALRPCETIQLSP